MQWYCNDVYMSRHGGGALGSFFFPPEHPNQLSKVIYVAILLLIVYTTSMLFIFLHQNTSPNPPISKIRNVLPGGQTHGLL